MRRGGPIARISNDERGAILVMFALSLPVILLFASFVIDTANWWEHKRHLQMEADAAALAGASRVAIPCDSTAVQAETLKYSGIGGSTYNAQIGDTPPERLHMAVNSKTYPLQDSPVDETVAVGDPCETAMVDVKLTESDTPWFFGIAPALGISGPDFINAHARATIVKVESLGGALPIGVPDINPKRGKVQFIDEDDPNKRVLGEADLQRIGTFNGYAKWEVPSTSPISLTVENGLKNIGTRVIFSGGTSLTCGQPLVDCYDSGSADGLLHLRGWTDENPGGNPVVRSVGLRAASCADAYFSYSSTTCPTGLSADVDFGTSDPTTVGAKVSAVAGGKTYNATYTGGRWELASNNLIPLASAAGPVPIELRWEQTQGMRNGQTCTNGGNNPCKGSFGTVQRAFSGSDTRSGPIRIAKIYESGLPLSDYSLKQCNVGEDASACTHNLTVEIGLLGALSDARTIDAPVVALRVEGSQNQSLDCDPGQSQLKQELANGCGPTYTVNQGTACPPQINTLWGSPQPWPCVALQTGNSVGQMAPGINLRVLGDEKPSTCTAPNLWDQDFPTFSPDDPRIVQVFLTPYGSFTGSGNDTVAVTNFATFYITGWAGNPGFANPCTSTDDYGGMTPEKGFIYGRFIKYIQTLPSGGGTVKCDFESFGACTAVLTD
jgi:Flp pilus assembly protein TadG